MNAQTTNLELYKQLSRHPKVKGKIFQILIEGGTVLKGNDEPVNLRRFRETISRIHFRDEPSDTFFSYKSSGSPMTKDKILQSLASKADEARTTLRALRKELAGAQELVSSLEAQVAIAKRNSDEASMQHAVELQHQLEAEDEALL